MIAGGAQVITGGAQILSSEVSKTAHSLTTWLLPTLKTIQQDLISKRLPIVYSSREELDHKVTAAVAEPRATEGSRGIQGLSQVTRAINQTERHVMEKNALTEAVSSAQTDEVDVAQEVKCKPIPVARLGLKRRTKMKGETD